MKKRAHFFPLLKRSQVLVENSPSTTGKGIPQTYFTVFTGIVSQGECSFEHLKIYSGLLACFKLVAETQHRSFGWHLFIS